MFLELLSSVELIMGMFANQALVKQTNIVVFFKLNTGNIWLCIANL